MGQVRHLENGYGRAVVQRHQSYLSVLSGCVPYPAVDAKGRVSEGLPRTVRRKDARKAPASAITARSNEGTYGASSIPGTSPRTVPHLVPVTGMTGRVP